MNISEINTQVKELQNQIKKAKEGLYELFVSELTSLFKEYPHIKNINCYLNNHEFNDGDPTSFNLNYDDLNLVFEDELGNETEYNGYPLDKEKEFIRDKFITLFQKCDIESFYEDNFSEDSGTITFSYKNKLDVESNY